MQTQYIEVNKDNVNSLKGGDYCQRVTVHRTLCESEFNNSQDAKKTIFVLFDVGKGKEIKFIENYNVIRHSRADGSYKYSKGIADLEETALPDMTVFFNNRDLNISQEYNQVLYGFFTDKVEWEEIDNDGTLTVTANLLITSI